LTNGEKRELAANLTGYAIDFLQTGSLATQFANEEQLRAANLVAADLLNAVDDFGIEREDTLHALAKAHLAHREGALGAFVNGDDKAFKGLQALFIAFLDLDLDPNLVTGHERGQIGALKLVGQALHDGMNGHCLFLRLNSEFSV
jgi:hypothetical protein